MKLSSKLERLLNDQINLELCSAYAYFAMAAYFEHTAFTGFGKWMKLQAKEELDHAGRFFKYMVERGGKITLEAIPEPKSDYKSPLDAFKASLAHEQRVSAAICGIYDIAGAEKDFATLSFLKWFLDEQVEEEKNVGDVLARLELAGDNLGALFQIDQHAGRRAEEEKG
jgi:ferritin